MDNENDDEKDGFWDGLGVMCVCIGTGLMFMFVAVGIGACAYLAGK